MLDSIETIVENTLYSAGVDAYYLYRPSEVEENAVFNYTMKPVGHFDNEVHGFEYSLLINTYVNIDRDINKVRDKIIEAMTGEGFRLQPVPTPQKEKDYINIALRFKITKYV